MKWYIYSLLLILLVSATVYGLGLTYTAKIIEDSSGQRLSFTIYLKGSIMAGKPFPIAIIGNQAIFDMMVILEPTQATISWNNEKIVLKDIEEKELFMSRYQRIPSIQYLFNEFSSLLGDPNFLTDMLINKWVQSSRSFAENYEEKVVRLDENSVERTSSFNINSIENGPVQLKRLYNFLVSYLEKRMRSQLSKYQSIHFNKIPIFILESPKQYIKEIPTRMRIQFNPNYYIPILRQHMFNK